MPRTACSATTPIPSSDPLTVALVTNVARGTLTLNANGSFAYTPVAGDNGTVTFTYHASDATHTSNDATVTITITAVNDPPAAVADSYTTTEDTPLTVGAASGVLANDTDPDAGTTLTAVLAATSRRGSLTLSSTGGFTFTPAPNFNGTASFTYRASDGAASSAAVTVTITITPANDAPFITSAPATSVDEGVTYRYTFTAPDPDGDSIVFGATALPTWLNFTPPATIAGLHQNEVGAHRVHALRHRASCAAHGADVSDYGRRRRQCAEIATIAADRDPKAAASTSISPRSDGMPTRLPRRGSARRPVACRPGRA